MSLRVGPARLLQWPRVMRVLLRIVQTALQLCPASAAWALARRFSIRADGKSSQADRDFGSAKVVTRTDNQKLPTTAAARGRARLQLYALVRPPDFPRPLRSADCGATRDGREPLCKNIGAGLRLEALTGMLGFGSFRASTTRAMICQVSGRTSRARPQPLTCVTRRVSQ